MIHGQGDNPRSLDAEILPPETCESQPSGQRQGPSEAPAVLIEFASLYDRHLPALVRYAQRFVGSEVLAWDIVQEAMMHVLDRIRANEIVRLRPAYLFKVVKHEALHSLDHQRVVEEKADALAAEWRIVAADADEPRRREALAADLDEAISRLSQCEEEVIERIRINGEPYARVAEAMGSKLNTTRTHYRRAIRKLRRWLTPMWWPGGGA